ncbi:hypothetical protein GCM10009841_23150 [Microlunatus panaciterrae]
MENLFDRPRAMGRDLGDRSAVLLQAHADLNAMLEHDVYTDRLKTAILERLRVLRLLGSDAATYAVLRQIRGRLLRRSKSGGTTVVAGGRGDWIGWVELTTEAISEVALRNTIRVITDVNPDVMAVVEAESRVALKRFLDAGFAELPVGSRFGHVMVIDGNDDRGIDVGIVSKPDYPIESVRSHVDDVDAYGRVFSRDSPEYTIRMPSGRRLVVIVCHLKSKGYGGQAASNATRLRQATRTAEIYRRLRAERVSWVAVVGDFNDTPASAPLEPLLQHTDLRDISQHPAFVADVRPGTYGNATASEKIDYVLLSPQLFERVRGGGVNRMGVWGGVNGDLFPHYPTITRPSQAASDHAAIFADLDTD